MVFFGVLSRLIIERLFLNSFVKRKESKDRSILKARINNAIDFLSVTWLV